MTPAIYAVATMDTKGEELAYLAECVRAAGASVRTVDVGTLEPPSVAADISRDEVRGEAATSTTTDRGEAVTAMGMALADFLVREHAAGRVSGVIGIGGTGGTALITRALRVLPIGLPKVMVSTVASGNTAGYVDCSDITMMPSIVDVAGLNEISKRILANAAHAIAGMVLHQNAQTAAEKVTLGMTMFGVTTPCVNQVREALEETGCDALVFHATGTGGRAMERLVESGMIQGVLDITTTEVPDRLIGGVFPCGPDRFGAVVENGIPCVLSFGAVDMVNFGARPTVPEKFSDRLLYEHNEQITLMRTTVEENREIGRWIAERLGPARAPLVVMIPEGGVSMLDAPGMPFHDPQADAALFDAFESALPSESACKVIRLPYNINDPEFAAAIVEQYLSLDRSCSTGAAS
ncbi:MAG: Tm-1-like ATP-binding domain-containing protein [Maioricimonas sp. JB045]